jgi:hypothetical protein
VTALAILRIFAVWFALSIPVSLVAGRWLADLHEPGEES